MEASSTDIFSLTESKMRSPSARWFFCDFQYPTYSLNDVVARLKSLSLDAGSPLVVREYYKQSCTLQCKFHRVHRGKHFPKDSPYEEGIRATSFIDNSHRCSRGPAGRKSNRKSSINRMTDSSSCCGSVSLFLSAQSKKDFTSNQDLVVMNTVITLLQPAVMIVPISHLHLWNLSKIVIISKT